MELQIQDQCQICSPHMKKQTLASFFTVCMLPNRQTQEELLLGPKIQMSFFSFSHSGDAIDSTIILDTGTGNRRRQINISKLAQSFSKQLRDAFLGRPIHAFTVCDTTSCFAGKGKLKPLKIVTNDEDLTRVFARLGTEDNICNEDQSVLEHFVCKLYGKPKHTSVDQVRYDKISETFSVKKSILSSSHGIDLGQMPPCKKVLKLHMQRANYQTLIWRKAVLNYPDLPKPETSGWTENAQGDLEIQWYKDNFIPDELQDVLADRNHTDEDEQRECDDIDEYDSSDDDTEEDDSDEELDNDSNDDE